MRWPALTLKQLLAVAMALYLVLSLAAVHGALLDHPLNTSDNTTTADVGDTAVPNTTSLPSPNAIHQQNGTATLNCSTLAAGSLPPDSGSPATVRNTSRPVFPASYNASTQSTGTNLAARVGPSTGNETPPATEMRRAVPASVQETCRLIERYSPPEWVTEMAANRTAAASRPATNGTDNSADAYRNNSDIAAAQLALASDLRDIFTDDSLSRRGATFAAADLALAERQAMAAAGQPNGSIKPLLAVQQTKLRGASDLLTTAETDSPAEAGSLYRTTTLTETAFIIQSARLQTGDQPVDLDDVTLPTTTVPDHDTPVAATVAILETHDVELTDEEAAELQVLGTLPVSTQRELTDFLDAYLVYYRTVQAANGTDTLRVRAAQLQLLEATADLERALNDTDALGSVNAVSTELVGSPLQVGGVVSIDLSRTDNTYTEDYSLQLDVGGDDTYNNNAGGANASGKSADVAALIDLGGSDTYNGRNGGGRYIVTKASPSVSDPRVSLPKKGVAAGFLLDAGTGDDTYNADAHGSNGGGRRGVGFLVDTGGDDTYSGSGKGTNGAGSQKGTGFLLDAGTGDDTYTASGKGRSNGGARGGRGFLFDVGGNDIYNGSNGAAGGALEQNYLTRLGRRCETDPGEDNIRDKPCKILFSLPNPPEPRGSGGFLLDGGGTDIYNGANGGAGNRGAGFLLDAGTGDDTYDGRNGGAAGRGNGFLLDTGGNDTYKSGNDATNGGGHVHGFGFLMDGGTGDDTYNATTEGGTQHWQRQDLPPGSRGTNGGGWQYGRGFLVDAGGNDAYLAGSVATNGGAILEREPDPGRPTVPKRVATGFLLDVAGNDTYTAHEAAVNGGADTAVGLLYDNAGSDFYTTTRQRCKDCSDIPKGTVGAQVDRGSGPGGDRVRVGAPEVLVVDDDAGTATADCPDASYRAIQPAVNAAEFGDTVRVCAGTYPGNVTIDTTNVTLRAAESGQVILDGEHKRRFGVALNAGRTTVTGFTARNFVTNTRPGVFHHGRNKVAFLAIGPQTTVSNNVIRNSGTGVRAAGLYTDSLLAETPLSEEEEATVIRNNTVTNTSLGLSVVGTANVKISSNTIRETPRGIILGLAGELTVRNNTVSGQAVPVASEQRGITAIRSSEVTMTDNTVTGFTAPANRTRPSGALADGIGIEIRTPRGRGREATHTLRNNTMANNTYNLHVTSGRRSAYQHINIGPTNTVNGKPVLYLVGATNMVIGPESTGKLPTDALAELTTNRTKLSTIDTLETPGYVACVRCTDVTIRNLELAHNGQGVLIARSSGTRINNVTVHDTIQGISVQGSPSNTEVTHSTVQESFHGIVVRHNCAKAADALPFVLSRFGRLFGGNTETCVIPSVLLANNTIQQTGLSGTRYTTANAIRVAGTGVTVRGNSITDVIGRGIDMRHVAPPTTVPRPSLVPLEPIDLLPDSVPDPTVVGNTLSIANSSVINNRVANTAVGVSIHGTQGMLVRGNTISDVGLGFLSGHNSGPAYRNNIVVNATTGMFISPSETELTARNNSFRDVRWGLDGHFRYPGASVSHNIGTTNTVNGERILWLTGVAYRTIDASDANMVVCVNCVNVTVKDMTIADNGHGVVLWESTASRVTDVTVEDTLRTGVLIRGGQNNTVANTTIIDSTWPIYTMPSPVVSKSIRRDVGRLAPIGLPRTKRLLRQSSGSVRIINNHVMVDDARWPADQHRGPPRFTKPDLWGHFGIFLFNPTTATVTGNNVTGNRWGITHWRGQLSELRIANNTITQPKQQRGLGRSGGNSHFGGPVGQMIGIRVSAADQANGSIVARNNTLTAGTRPIGTQNSLFGIIIEGKEVPSTTVVDNRVQGYQQGVRVAIKSNNSTVSIRRNRLTGAKTASVFVTGPTPGDAVEIHQNLLNPLRFGYGVKYSMGGGGGGHMMAGRSGGSSPNHTAADHKLPVDATCNRWAAPSGPSSQRMVLVDPVTDAPADGNGSAVSHGHKHGLSNVHFHPWIGESPGRTCSKELVGTKTPTPTPGPTRTPWPTVESGDGNGTGSGPGDGPGSGDGNDTGKGPGPATAAGGGEGTSTATAWVAATDTPTGTPPPTATPEIVPGFGVGVWLVAFALLVAVLAARRRD